MNNPIENWKNALLTLPDATYYALLKNYLGEIKTPFNKHDLLMKLERFLRKKETADRITSLLSKRDRSFLTAVHLLEGPTIGEISGFFSESESPIDIHHSILNLEDRLLIYEENNTGRLLLNPILRPVIESGVIDTASLFNGTTAPVQEGRQLWLNDSLLIAMLSLIHSDPSLFRRDGSLKKKKQETLLALLPPGIGSSRKRIRLLLNCLLNSGIIRRQGDRARISRSRLRDLAALPAKKRLCLLWLSAAACDMYRIEETAGVLGSLLDLMNSSLTFPFSSMLKIFYLAEKKTGRRRCDMDCLSRLIEIGVFIEEEEGRLRKNPSVDRLFGTESDAKGGIILQATFEITLKPGLPLSEGIIIAFCADLKQFDQYPQYELNKTSLSRGLSAGISREELTSCLQRSAGKELPQNIAFSLHSWEEELRGIEILTAAVVIADEKRRFLFEHSEDLKKLIYREPAPGVYLIREEDRKKMATLLKSQGVEIIAPRDTAFDFAADDEKTAAPAEHPAPDISFLSTALQPEARQKKDGRQRSSKYGSENIEEELTQSLNRQSLPADVRTDIKHRIERKLILFPSQIGDHLSGNERMEARGLDYLGKVRVIKNALSGRNILLEIIERAPDGSPLKRCLSPRELVKQGGSLFLLAEDIKEKKEVTIHIEKISLVRKLKGSLFS